jgi:hypothetical protein
MSEHTMATKAAPAPNRALVIGLWSAQVTLAGIFGMAGVSKCRLAVKCKNAAVSLGRPVTSLG